MNFRNYPWTDSSSLIQGMSVGTTFSILEKVTTTADPTLRHSDWYRVRLNDGREGYFWAGEEFIQKVASGGSAGPIGVGGIGVSPIKEGPIGVGGIRVTPIDNSNDNTPIFPSISIASAYDANDGDNFVVAGSKIILSGKSNSQNIRFYLGDIPLTQGHINFDDDNFSATLTVPPGVSPGSYQIKAIVNSPTGDATSSGHWMVVTHIYDRNSAINYAKKYAKTPNPEYNYEKTKKGIWGLAEPVDCTNFASQCLIAGGLILLDEALDYKDWLGKKFLKQPTFTLADALAKYLVEEKKYAVSDNVKDKNVEEKIKAIAEKMKPGDLSNMMNILLYTSVWRKKTVSHDLKLLNIAPMILKFLRIMY
jgi:hypothetical protein